jgi:hypothetical protein
VTPAEIHALVALMSQAADAVSIPFAQREHLVSALGHSVRAGWVDWRRARARLRTHVVARRQTIMDDIVVLLAFCRAGRQGTAHAVQLLVLQNVCLRFLLKAVDPSLFAARVLHTMLLGRERVNALVLGDDAPDSTLGRVRAALEAQLPAAFRAALLDDVHMRRYVISELIGDVHVALNQGQPTILPVLECSLTSCGRLRGEFIMHRRGALLSELVRALFADDVIRLTWMQAIVRAFCVRPSLEDDTMAFDVSRRQYVCVCVRARAG